MQLDWLSVADKFRTLNWKKIELEMSKLNFGNHLRAF